MRNVFVLSSKMEALATIMLDKKITIEEGADRMQAFIEDELYLTEAEGWHMIGISTPLVYVNMQQDELECVLTLAYSKVMFERKKVGAST